MSVYSNAEIIQLQDQALQLSLEGKTYREIAEIQNRSVRTISRRIKAARKRERLDPEISRYLTDQKKMTDLGGLHSGWILNKDKDGSGESLYFYLGPDDESIAEADKIITEIVDEIKAYAPDYSSKQLSFPPVTGDHLLVISPADIHMGKLAEAMETGDEYNKQIAQERTREGVQNLLRAASMFGLEVITINTGNDGLHVDNARKTTTRGTPQDTDGSIFSMFDALFWTWVWVIEEASNYAPVHVVFDPSNHPWVSDWMLNRAIMAFFSSHPNVTFDVQMSSIRHRKYQVYGSNLIGYTHGDGAKTKDLPALMQHECREWWGKTKRGYWLTKHIHHKDHKMFGLTPMEKEKDHIGVTVIRTNEGDYSQNVSVEVVRSPSNSDGWHDRNGYVGALKAVEAFLFHADRGQVARFTYPFY
jgi:hypothetical protein